MKRVRLRLSTRLGERRLTQAELACRTGIRPATINDYYHELAERVSLDYLARICTVLRCDLSDLIDLEESEGRIPIGRAERIIRRLEGL